MPPMAEDCQPQVYVRHCKLSLSHMLLENSKTMQYLFTPAAERAICHAAAWLGGSDCNEWPGVALLLGLLAEPECRAALMLARCGIDTIAVRGRWEKKAAGQPEASTGEPEASASGCNTKSDTCARHLFDLDQSGGDENISPCIPISLATILPAIEIFLQAAQGRLVDLSRPLTLATEHLLLGLVAAEHEVSHWLCQRGMDPDALEKEIHAIYGRRAEPQPMEARMTESPHPLPLSQRERGDIGPHNMPLYQMERGNIGSTPVLRILDAALNRAREGLRVVEDYVRFVLDDRHLTEQCKVLRHDLAAALGPIAAAGCLASRETRADVGTLITTPSEQHRSDAAGVLTANLLRLQESLRTLEEFGKLLDIDSAAAFEQLRYRAYTLHRAVETTRLAIERLAAARLCVLIDGRSTAEELERLARGLIAAGVQMLQLRDKRLDDRRLLERARLLARLTAGAGALLIVNDRPDVARLARTDGVHLGQQDQSVKDARTIVGPEALIGVSTHSIDEARQAVMDGANYIGAGPTFPSGTKHFQEFPGVELLRSVAAEIRLPAFAIGGIDCGNVAEVCRTGFRRIAVGGAIAEADDPPLAAREILAIIDQCNTK